MFDQAIIFIDKYFIWYAIVLACLKLLHIIIYKGLHLRYIVTHYFIVFSGFDFEGSTSKKQRHRFRQIHNMLTVSFYFFLTFWLIIHVILK